MFKILKIPLFIGSIVLVTIIAYIDVWTGFVPDLTILYLVPIVATIYVVGKQWALVVAAAATLAQGIANIQLGAPLRSDLLLGVATHAIIFVLSVALIDRLLNQLRIITELEQRRSRDLDIAKKVHESVFTSIPEEYQSLTIGSRIVFARELGGDYYYFQTIDGKLFFCLADISGKSVSAALFSALLYQNIEEALEHTSDVTAVLSWLNSQMYRTLPEDMFITCICCIIDKDGIAFINAGHEPSLLYSKKESRVTFLKSDMVFPIGIQPELTSETTRIDFKPGDVLLSVTDGVTDSPWFRDRPFQKLEELLLQNSHRTPQDIADIVFNKAAPNGSDDLQDDTVIICIKRASQGEAYPARSQQAPRSR